jgi:hypothetical protein
MIREVRTLAGIFVLFSGLCWSAMPCVGQRSATPYSDQNSQSQIPLLLDGLPDLIPDRSSTANNYSSFIVTKKNERIAPRPSVDWKGLSKDSLQFLVIMNGFRIATEPGTRAGLHNPFFSGYFKAVSNMHGWDDGDPFYVNYIGHPIQGAVSTFIWTNRDGEYEREHIGWNSSYLKSKLRAGAYAYVLSVSFELGPLSEASIGEVQRYHPANGFVDHVVTPTVGLMWSVLEDEVDDSLVRYIEKSTDSRDVKILARAFLNPSRSFANLMGRRRPWYRSNRPGPSEYNSFAYYTPFEKKPVSPPPGVAPFQFNMHFEERTYFGKNASDPCVGGGGELGFRVADNWQVVGEVTGCKQTGMPPNFSGDSLTYAIGPQWTGRLSRHWVAHTRVLVGGNKVTQEQLFPDIKAELQQEYKNQHNIFPPLADQYIRDFDNNAFAVITGGGFDYKFNNALLFRSSLDYSHTWNHDINGVNYRNSLRFSSGFVLNMGTW